VKVKNQGTSSAGVFILKGWLPLRLIVVVEAVEKVLQSS